MKKALNWLIVLTSVVFLSACAGKQTDSTAKAPVLNRIQQKGELVVGTAGSMPPLNMATKDGRIIGLEIDIARYIANEMGVSLRLETRAFNDLLPALDAGEVDMILSGMTITSKRNLKYAFVGPYYASGKAFLTKRKTIANAKKAEDVDQEQVIIAALKGSTSQDFVEKTMPKAKLVATVDYDQAVNLVLEDKVDALVADYPICVVSLLKYPNAGLLSYFTPLTYEPIGIALPAGDPLLINWMENFMATLTETGKLEALHAKWFNDPTWVKSLP
jgi:polar amino acid transport system substrate-binding protein